MEEETTFDENLKRVREMSAQELLTNLSVSLNEARIMAKDPYEEELAQLKAAVPDKIALAAERIRDADCLLLTTGAGFSADSGLAVYVDVAKVRPLTQAAFAL